MARIVVLDEEEIVPAKKPPGHNLFRRGFSNLLPCS